MKSYNIYLLDIKMLDKLFFCYQIGKRDGKERAGFKIRILIIKVVFYVVL